MAEEHLQRASELIRQRRYAEARAILQYVDHPKAREWLGRIDQITAQSAYPQNPYQTGYANPYPPAQPQWQPAAPPGYAPAPAVPMQKPVTFGTVVSALIGGLIFAVIAAGIWAIITLITDNEVGWAALIVGGLTGWGAMLFSGKRHGAAISLVAILAALAGIALGKYLSIYLIAQSQFAEFYASMQPWDPEFIRIVLDDPMAFLSAYDLLWVVLAIAAAFSVSRRG